MDLLEAVEKCRFALWNIEDGCRPIIKPDRYVTLSKSMSMSISSQTHTNDVVAEKGEALVAA